MSETERILDQMARAFSGDAWHGPSLMTLIEGVSAEDASSHSVRSVHSIWELVRHISAWNTIVQHRLEGKTVEVTPEQDWPRVWEVSEAEWKRTIENLVESRSRLRKVGEKIKDTELDQKPAGAKDSRYVLLHGVIQHDLYHAGQIAILKKTLS